MMNWTWPLHMFIDVIMHIYTVYSITYKYHTTIKNTQSLKLWRAAEVSRCGPPTWPWWRHWSRWVPRRIAAPSLRLAAARLSRFVRWRSCCGSWSLWRTWGYLGLVLTRRKTGKTGKTGSSKTKERKTKRRLPKKECKSKRGPGRFKLSMNLLQVKVTPKTMSVGQVLWKGKTWRQEAEESIDLMARCELIELLASQNLSNGCHKSSNSPSDDTESL